MFPGQLLLLIKHSRAWQPEHARNLGWTQSTLKLGMNMSLTGIRAREGSHKVIARNIVADGNRIIAWPSENLAH